MKLVLSLLVMFAAAAQADTFVCQTHAGKIEVVEPQMDESGVAPANFAQCVRQEETANPLLEEIVYKKHPRHHASARGYGNQCFSFYCRDCPHGSTTNGYPLLFGYCYR